VTSDEQSPLFLQPRVSAPRAALARPPARNSNVPGEAGLWVFILGDMTLFGAFFVVFLLGRIREPALFATSTASLNLAVGAVNTLVLLTSSLLVVSALKAWRANQPLAAKRLLRATMCCALIFAVLKSSEYVGQVGEGHVPAQNAFFTFYFVLTGVHLLHLVVGTALLWWLSHRVRSHGTPSAQLPFAEGVAAYWHMVDLLWIALFTLLYVVPTA
jgi:nitric oxide reductase NorE protein